VTSVTASAPLASSGGATPNITLGSCATGQVLKWNGSAWSCAADSSQAYAAGPGLRFPAAPSPRTQPISSGASPGLVQPASNVSDVAADGTATAADPRLRPAG